VGDGLAAVFLLGSPVARANGQLIQSGGANLLLDCTLRTGTHRHHRQHRRHAHADADHRQQRLQAVAANRRRRHLNDGMQQETAHVR
jgi:hypothetical protein